MKPGRTSPQLIRSSSGEPADQGYLPNKIRLVQLKRRGAAPLGFSIRGGREHGTGVFVSQVTGGSEAHHKGLRVGDQIIRINGYPIDHFIHEEVLALLKAKPNIVLKVKSVGMIPIKDNKRDPITWKMVEPDPCSSGSDGTHSVSSGSSLDEFVETKVFISGIGGSSLGCSVVKGPPELPGIFVQTVKPHGLAEIAGLEIGDQITEVNGQGFVNVEFSEAIAMLKSFKEMALTVRKGAGLELFPEERLRRINARLCNRNTATKPRNGHALNGNHTLRNSRTMYTNGTNGKGSPESFHSLHDTLTNGSLSEMSDRSTSLSSSQSTSPVTNGHTAHTHANGNGVADYGHKLIRSPENGTHHHHIHHYGTNGQHQHLLLVPKLTLVGAEERQRLEDEKRRLHEKEQLLQLEAEKLAEERRQLEAQKQLQQLHHQQEHQHQSQPRPATMPAAPPAPPQMHVFAELHSVAQQRRLLREKAAQNGDDAAARKAGAARPGLRPDAKPSPDVLIKQKQHEQLMVEFREVHKKMFGSSVAALSERSGAQQSQVDAELRKTAALVNVQETAKKGERPIARAAHVAKGPAPKPPVATGAKDVPITDSRGPDSKPPKSFFGPKPLVTIGSYPDGSNPRPNRFARPAKVEIVDAEKGTTTLDSSGKSSDARTPSPGRTQSPDGPKMTVSINCKAPNRPSLSTRFSTNTNATQPVLANLANDVTEGAVVKTLTFKKDGPLNLILDGGLNSAQDGRIVVAEVREGGMIPVDGEVRSGDQILMVDNTRLVNTTLTAARVAIQNAMASADNDLRLTIAKMP